MLVDLVLQDDVLVLHRVGIDKLLVLSLFGLLVRMHDHGALLATGCATSWRVRRLHVLER